MPTLDEIRAMNPNEARKLPVEELIRAIYEGETYQVWTAREQDEHGNWLRQAWNVHNQYDGNLVSRHEIKWTYWEPGVVKDIDVQEGNRVQRVSHSMDAKVQPTVKKYIVVEPIPLPEKIVEGAAGGVTGAASGIGSFVKKILGRGE